MDEIEKHRWQALVDRFQLPKKGVAPWDAMELAQQFTGASHGERCVIQFLLNVWDPGGAWECGKCDVIEAFFDLGREEPSSLFELGNRSLVALAIPPNVCGGSQSSCCHSPSTSRSQRQLGDRGLGDRRDFGPIIGHCSTVFSEDF